MYAYAVQRFFFHLSLWVFFPACFVAADFLFQHEYRLAGIAGGVAVMAIVYRSAFFTSRDVRLRRTTAPPQKSSPEAK